MGVRTWNRINESHNKRVRATKYTGKGKVGVGVEEAEEMEEEGGPQRSLARASPSPMAWARGWKSILRTASATVDNET